MIVPLLEIVRQRWAESKTERNVIWWRIPIPSDEDLCFLLAEISIFHLVIHAAAFPPWLVA